MDDGSKNFRVWRLKVLLLVSSVVSLSILFLAAYEENLTGEWRGHQQTYRATLIKNAPNDTARQAAKSMEVRLQQTFLPDLERIDRCVTCHAAIEDPAQAKAAQPLRTHSDDFLKHHPVAKFGCTVCHDGQGRAVERDAAHGNVAHWLKPLLRGESVYTSCGRCHFENDLYQGRNDLFAGTRKKQIEPLAQAELNASVPGHDDPNLRAIGRGKRIVLESGCLGCHAYRGRGAKLGPDITHVGDKTIHDFDFGHVKGEHTVAQWMTEHFLNPAQVVPGTLMPEMGLNKSQAKDLSQYMLSLHRKDMPSAYTPTPSRHRIHKPDADQGVGGKQLFAMFCSACHGKLGQGNTVLDPELMMLADPPKQMMTPALNNADTLAVASDDYLRYIVRNGRHGTSMIGWKADMGGLTDGEIDRLISYIRQWAGPGADLSLVASEAGNARLGKALFSSRCKSCHGGHGEGGIGPSLRSPTFLASSSDNFLASAIVHGRANTAMPAWKQLGAEEVSDLLAFIRNWEQKPADRKEVLGKLASDQKPSSRALHIGQVLYRAQCSNCHGVNGQGGIGPSLNNDAFLSVADNGYLYDAIVKGRPGTAMPSWKHIKSQDMVDMINFMRSWNDRRQQKLEPWLARGDWERGARIYKGVCAGCHGLSGEGSTGIQLNNPMFLASATDAMLRHWVQFGKSGTEMRAFLKGHQGMVDLKPSQIEDIISHVRRFEIHRPTVTSRPGVGIVHEGKRIYQSVCAQCHGKHGEGVTGSALSNPEFLRSASDGFLLATIALGRDGTAMRPMGRGAQGNVELRPDDISNVVAYIRSWEHNPPPRPPGNVPARYVIGADLKEGKQLYGGHCAGCHGSNGGNGWAPSLNSPGFLIAASDGFLQATIARGRASTPMRPFGRGGQGVAELSSQQINNIVAHIRSWAPTGYKPIHGPIKDPPKAPVRTKQTGKPVAIRDTRRVEPEKP